MTHLFIDPFREITLEWEDIIAKLDERDKFYPFKQNNTPEEVYLQLINSLLLDEPVVLPDADFSKDEIREVGITDRDLNKWIENRVELPKSFEAFLSKLKSLEHWSITLFTSGTTGQPKKVIHNFNSITRGVKISDNYKHHIWGWAYNATHMAGIQVFFQALLNHNLLVSLFGYKREQVLRALREHEVTHLSATPTFYRMLLPINPPLKTIKNVTSGGEKMDIKLINQLKVPFPDAKFRNVYASTEAGSLFSGEGEYFKVSEKFRDLIKFEDNELCLHRSLLGEGNGINLSKEWYKTGDLVEFSTEDMRLFKFLSRRNEMINVGGYKVNPHEVESCLDSHPKVIQSLVYGKKNSVVGNIVMADVVISNRSVTENELRDYLDQNLQSYKLPRMINFVDSLEFTRSGKKVRKK